MYPREEGPARAVLTQSSRAASDPLNNISGAAELRAARAGPLLAVPPRALVARRATPARATTGEGGSDHEGATGGGRRFDVPPRGGACPGRAHTVLARRIGSAEQHLRRCGTARGPGRSPPRGPPSGARRSEGKGNASLLAVPPPAVVARRGKGSL